ncbi:hypothetical protein Tco_0266015 [Tanacetum coccineum]
MAVRTMDRAYLPGPRKGMEKLSFYQKLMRIILRACPHHGFTELTQIDTFYNGLNDNDQDTLNAAAGGNLLSKTTREALNIIENKSKVHYSRNKPNASRMNTTSRESVSKTDERIDKLVDQLLTLVEIVSKKVVTPALIKAVEETCVTCGGAHSWYNCPTIDNNQASVYATTVAVPLLFSESRPSLTSFETSNFLLEEFADELTLLDPFPPRNEDVDVEAKLREIELLLNRDPSTNFSPWITFNPNPERFTNEPSLVCLPPPGEECECNVPDSQTINFSTFSNPLFNDLLIRIISSRFNPNYNEVLDSISKNDYFDAKSYLPKSPLNHDTLTVFSPKNDLLHHEFTGELITIPPRIVREHEDYISRMWLLCGNSSSRSPENFHMIIESLPIFPIPIQDSNSHKEYIDIFPGPDDLIPPEIERDD